MDKNYLNKKWLAGDLTNEETEAFDKIEDNHLLKKIVEKAPSFSASHFSEPEGFETLKGKIQAKKSIDKKRNWIAPMLRIAAVIVVTLGIYSLFFMDNATNIETSVAEKRLVDLPDASQVTLNAVSSVSYNKKTWENKRELTLKGEAFFKVAKGSTFDVFTQKGKVTVVGTQFNVKTRGNIFEVNCFEGKVIVTYNHKTWALLPGHMFSLVNNQVTSGKVPNGNQPYWMQDISYFKKVPFIEVVKELERQYGVNVTVNSSDENILFTGGFKHNDLPEALRSITTPLKLEFIMETPTKIMLHHSE